MQMDPIVSTTRSSTKEADTHPDFFPRLVHYPFLSSFFYFTCISSIVLDPFAIGIVAGGSFHLLLSLRPFHESCSTLVAFDLSPSFLQIGPFRLLALLASTRSSISIGLFWSLVEFVIMSEDELI